MINKVKPFDNHFATDPISGAKVITILVNFAQKIEELLDNMRSLFNGLEPTLASQAIPLKQLLDISMETEAIPSFNT